MTEEGSCSADAAQAPIIDGSSEQPTRMSMAEIRKQKRFTLTLPITANLNAFQPSGLPSPTRSTAAAVTPSEDAARPTTPSEPNFLTALAAQERRVLELKEELVKAEQVLHKLKKEWAMYEVNKKRQDIRDSRKARSARHGQQASSAASIKSNESDAQSDRAAREAEQRRAMHYQAKTAQRKVFSGSKHARALSLLSPDPMDGRFPQTLPAHNADGPTAALIPRDGVQPSAPRTVPHQRVMSGEMRRSKSAEEYADNIDMPQEVLIRAGRQMASDFKDGLWTFLEDLRQVTVGDEAAAAGHRPRAQRPDVNIAIPQAMANKPEKRPKSMVASPSRTQRSKRMPNPEQQDRNNMGASLVEHASPKDSAVGFDEANKTNRGLVDIDAPSSPTTKRTPRKRATSRPEASRRLPAEQDDADAWDHWDSPQTQSDASMTKDSSNQRSDEGVSFEQRQHEGGEMVETSIEEETKRDPIPWPTLLKSAPGSLRRTASHLMSEWEKSLSPVQESRHAMQPTDHYFDGINTVAVKKGD
ncbi:hypothetical protein CAC42_285 [Sphaceloma murrayae]|uniref:DUF4048 domain-containing protein n=1 Tax=Sphaceloma murrayae TaxID=2082308 RepID=A0A2K1QNG5_9PEZI|nr:hypothetical protein CAC42_285 [Sphaceloma murrayae]